MYYQGVSFQRMQVGFGPQFYGGGGGAFNCRGFYPQIWGGANQLFGMPCMPMPMMNMNMCMPSFGNMCMPGMNMPGMCMPGMGMGGGMEMMLMLLMMMQSMSQRMPQACPNNYPPAYQQQPPTVAPQGNPNPKTGIIPAYTANNGQTYTTVKPTGPTINSIGDNAAANFWPDYKKLQEFGKANGSMDGTFVTSTSSAEQDSANLDKLTATMDTAGQEIGDLITKASPQERAALKEEEAKMKDRIAQLQQQGKTVTPPEKLRMQAEYMDKLFKDGKINGELGTKNRAFIEMLDMGDRSMANMQLKWGTKNDASQWALDQSPFNPNRKVPANPAGQPQAVDPRISATVDRLAGNNATPEQKAQIAADLRNVPPQELDKLEKKGVKMRVLNDADFDRVSKDEGAASEAGRRTLGYYTPGDKPMLTFRSSELGGGVVDHEVGHALSDTDSDASQKEVEKLYNAYNDRTKGLQGSNPWHLTKQGTKMWSGYARKDAEEYRAEGYSMYHNSEATRNILKASDPDLYAFIEAREKQNQGRSA